MKNIAIVDNAASEPNEFSVDILRLHADCAMSRVAVGEPAKAPAVKQCEYGLFEKLTDAFAQQ